MNTDTSRFFVVVTQPGSALRFVVESNGIATAGRDATNTILLAHPLVSRHHARFSLRDGRFEVEDLGSRNGTTINGLPAPAAGPVEEPLAVAIGPYLLSLSTSVSEETWTAVGADGHVPRAMLERGTRRLHVDGSVVLDTLSPNEYSLLDLLALRQPNVVERTAVGDAVWGAGQWDIYMLHNLVSRLRRRIAQHPAPGEVIVTVPGVGYRLE